MTRTEALKLSGRSEHWLRTRLCSWCGQDLYRALRNGCVAMGEKCDPAKKNFGDDAMWRDRANRPIATGEQPK
jgi:hypothetical protein